MLMKLTIDKCENASAGTQIKSREASQYATSFQK